MQRLHVRASGWSAHPLRPVGQLPIGHGAPGVQVVRAEGDEVSKFDHVATATSILLDVEQKNNKGGSCASEGLAVAQVCATLALVDAVNQMADRLARK